MRHGDAKNSELRTKSILLKMMDHRGIPTEPLKLTEPHCMLRGTPVEERRSR